jgi:hypothetical protein
VTSSSSVAPPSRGGSRVASRVPGCRVVLVLAGLIGMSAQAPQGGWSWGMHGGSMMGWWSSGTTGAEGGEPVPDAPTVEVVATEFGFRPD